MSCRHLLVVILSFAAAAVVVGPVLAGAPVGAVAPGTGVGGGLVAMLVATVLYWACVLAPAVL